MAPNSNQPSKDTMVIDAIDHIAMCIADSISDAPDEERDKKRMEIVKTFAEGLLLKAIKAENRHKEPAKESISLYMSYIKPSQSERQTTPQVIVELPKEPELTDEEKIRKFRELRVAYEEQKERDNHAV